MTLTIIQGKDYAIFFDFSLLLEEIVSYYLCQTKLNNRRKSTERGDLSLLPSEFCSVKTQLHSEGNWEFSFLFELCLATIGGAFFSA